MMPHKYFLHRDALRTFAIVIGLTVFCLLPFSGALEIHHIFAEVDHDGHEHSDFDLCQWVQQHSSSLFVFEKPLSEVLPLEIARGKVVHKLVFVSFLGLSVQSPRPPPFSDFF